MTTDSVVETIVQQHAEDAAYLWQSHARAVQSPHFTLQDLVRVSERLAAHIDGLRIAGEYGWQITEQMISDDPGMIFVATLLALERRHPEHITAVLSVAEAVPAVQTGFLSALTWVAPKALGGTIKSWLLSASPFSQYSAIECCAAHRVDPGLADPRWTHSSHPRVRASALRAAGLLGKCDLGAACAAVSDEEEPEQQFWGVWSAVMLGERGRSLDALIANGLAPGEHRERGFRLSLQAMERGVAHEILQTLARDDGELRWLISGSGVNGDPAYIPWLIGHMKHDGTARLAGEAFSLMTGADLEQLQLERQAPENVEAGPNDDPDDPKVDTDPDEGLAWPDSERIQNWWAANHYRFDSGTRYFMGAPVTREHCLEILKNGYQRQRILAAHYLCLLNPGTPLFDTSAPAWRQQRLLAEMG